MWALYGPVCPAHEAAHEFSQACPGYLVCTTVQSTTIMWTSTLAMRQPTDVHRPRHGPTRIHPVLKSCRRGVCCCAVHKTASTGEENQWIRYSILSKHQGKMKNANALHTRHISAYHAQNRCCCQSKPNSGRNASSTNQQPSLRNCVYRPIHNLV